MLKKIGSDARRDIENLLDCKVNLKLWVKVKKDWRDSDFLMKNFGYDSKELDEKLYIYKSFIPKKHIHSFL